MEEKKHSGLQKYSVPLLFRETDNFKLSKAIFAQGENIELTKMTTQAMLPWDLAFFFSS